MPRAPRIQLSGATYHVTTRGDRQEAIFRDDFDRQALLSIFAQAFRRFDANALAYCLMGNHYHLVVRTHRANLSDLMAHINGVVTRKYNWRHGISGHLFQSRFHADMVDRDSYLLEVCRYVDLNPVRSKLTVHPAQWRWSSYRAHIGVSGGPAWLDSSRLHAHLLGWPPSCAAEGRRAGDMYAKFVAAGHNLPTPFTLARSVTSGTPGPELPARAPVRQRPLQDWMNDFPTREAGLRAAHVDGGWSMTAIARELDFSVPHISRLIRRAEGDR